MSIQKAAGIYTSNMVIVGSPIILTFPAMDSWLGLQYQS